MAWRPWYEEMGEINSAQGREDYARGVFGPRTPSPGRVAGMAASAGLISWGLSQILEGRRQRMNPAQELIEPDTETEQSFESEWIEYASSHTTQVAGISRWLRKIAIALEVAGESDSYRAHMFQRCVDVIDTNVVDFVSAVAARDSTATELALSKIYDAVAELGKLFPEIQL
jgi:hypothetical protein